MTLEFIGPNEHTYIALAGDLWVAIVWISTKIDHDTASYCILVTEGACNLPVQNPPVRSKPLLQFLHRESSKHLLQFGIYFLHLLYPYPYPEIYTVRLRHWYDHTP